MLTRRGRNAGARLASWTRARHLALALPLAALLYQLMRRSLEPVEHVLTIVPDDAFYYLSLARHFASSGVWTFDGGVSKTSGFHPFHAYVCALVFRLWPHVSAATVLVVHAWIGAVATAIGLWCVIRTVRPASGEPAVLGVALVAVAPNFLQQATNVMEWHWVVLFTAICLLAIVEGRARLAFAAGLAAALSRSDAPLAMAAALAAACVVALARRNRALLWPSALAFAGAAAGFAAVTAHNYVISHQLVQSSARIKAFWGTIDGYSLRYALEIATRAAAPGSLLIEVGQHSIKMVAAVHVAFALLLVVILRAFPPPAEQQQEQEDGSARDRRLFLAVFALLAVAGYVALYGTTSAAIQTWYTANFVVPACFLYPLALRPLRFFRCAGPALFAGLAALAVLGVRDADTGPYPMYPHVMHAGLWLKSYGPPGRVGSWNSGVLNFFEGGDVVNLDGLTNDDVVPYIMADKLHCYILAKDIRYVMDFEMMVGGNCTLHHRAGCPPYPALGGYTSGLFVRSLKPELVFPETQVDDPSIYGINLTLYAVDPAVLRSAHDCGPERVSTR